MKVDGKKFKEARESIKNDPVKIKKHIKDLADGKIKYSGKRAPKVGTQQWLADRLEVDVKTIQLLESGSAGPDIVNGASHYLEINGNNYVYGYGEKHIKCGANKYVDFRPMICPDPSGEYMKSNLMLTIDPLSLHFLEDDLTSVTLHEIKINIPKLDTDFTWWSFVNINPKSDWLGQVEETNEVTIRDHEIKFWPIMFKQTSLPNITWLKFVESIETMEADFFTVTVTLVFSHFEKAFDINIDRNELATNFKLSRQKYRSPHPYRIQTRPLVMA